MNELVLPVPKTVSATYVVPVSAPMSTVEAREQASRAVEARLTGPLRTLTAEWLAKSDVRIEVEAAGKPPPGLLDKELFGTPEQRVFLARARVRPVQCHAASIAYRHSGVEGADRPRPSPPTSAHPCWTRRRSRC